MMITVVIIGLNNIPGIVLTYLAIAVLAVTLTRTWRKRKNYLILLGVSFVGFFLLSFLVDNIYGIPGLDSGTNSLQDSIEIMAFNRIADFIVAFVFPVCFLVGLEGSVRLSVGRSKTGAAGDTESSE